ncbi:hypothetical protein [Streptomyces sp. NPDC093598]|uniref:hypothetical protein n=1 Tax=Streptomyces sp. NPDC093598 TaxID=3366046 RepID=UPI00380CEB1D
MLQGTPSVSGTSCRGEHIGELIEEATKGEEEDRQHAEEGEDGERHGRVQRFGTFRGQVTEPWLMRRAFVSSATVKWLELRSPAADVSPGVSVGQAFAQPSIKSYL